MRVGIGRWHGSTQTPTMNALRDPQFETMPPTLEQIVDVLLRSGEVWIVCRADNLPFPTLAEIGLCQSPLMWPHCVGVLGTDTLRLDLASFVAEITATTQKQQLSESDLEQGFNILTGHKEGQPVTLVVDAAERLTPEVIHYIQFAVISEPRLQVVFVTTKEFRHRLRNFPVLCERLQPDLVVDVLSIQYPLAPPSHRHDQLPPDATGRYEIEHFQETERQPGQNDQIDGSEEPGASLVWIEAQAASNVERQES